MKQLQICTNFLSRKKVDIKSNFWFGWFLENIYVFGIKMRYDNITMSESNSYEPKISFDVYGICLLKEIFC